MAIVDIRICINNYTIPCCRSFRVKKDKNTFYSHIQLHLDTSKSLLPWVPEGFFSVAKLRRLRKKSPGTQGKSLHVRTSFYTLKQPRGKYYYGTQSIFRESGSCNDKKGPNLGEYLVGVFRMTNLQL